MGSSVFGAIKSGLRSPTLHQVEHDATLGRTMSNYELHCQVYPQTVNMFKVVASVCALALMIQSSAGACLGAELVSPCGVAGPYGAFGAYDGLAYGGFGAYGAIDGFGAFGGPRGLAASNGAGLAVATASAYPSGVSVLSENAIEGPLAVAGALPFLGTVALEGALPTAGAGAVNYGCGNGAVAILAEDLAPAPLAGPLGYGIGAWGAEGFGYGPYGYGINGFAGPIRAGCGCGAL